LRRPKNGSKDQYTCPSLRTVEKLSYLTDRRSCPGTTLSLVLLRDRLGRCGSGKNLSGSLVTIRSRLDEDSAVPVQRSDRTGKSREIIGTRKLLLDLLGDCWDGSRSTSLVVAAMSRTSTDSGSPVTGTGVRVGRMGPGVGDTSAASGGLDRKLSLESSRDDGLLRSGLLPLGGLALSL
jgi:hypothetical protein